ncbi:TonB-dependent receptor [Sphingosinicella sp.]|uniref:TonB-dependent receptor n=1 Tax=Sphingosinicella sp. TaxID=1917971 RepID=UPI004037A7D7
MIRSLLMAGTAVLLPVPAFAQPPADGAQAQPRAPHRAQDLHSEEEQEIVVTGFLRNRVDILSGTSVVTGEELIRELRPTIGDTLARQAGVSATSFGPSASRPVLRGFQGDRVRILTDGIGSLDVSASSVDHAVAINPLTAERVEVLRGPSVLLFGSSAIGGVVNVIDSRIPRRIPEEPLHLEALLTYGSAADERSVNAAIDAPLGGNFVIHFDGNYTRTNDLEIGGFVLTPELRAQAAASPDPEIQELAELSGSIPNTASETTDFAAGLAWVDGQNNVGVSVNRYDSRYGVPIRYSLDPAVEAEAPTLDLRQTRVDARAQIDTGDGFIDMVRFRGGWADYRHFEIEDTGEIATSFFTEGVEARLEAVQSVRNGWSGGFGVQVFDRDYSVVGEEKYLPANQTRQLGLFALQTFELGAVRLEGGARYEHSRLRAEADPDIGNPALSRSFDTFSGSVGGSVALAPRLRFGVNLSHAERAPSAEELFANGPHAGTQAFEIGNPDFVKERSWGLEGTLRASGDGYSLAASVFHSWFDNYIYQQPTGQIEDDLPVFQYLQDDARYFGVELEGSVRLARIGGVRINADAVADYVRATIDGAGPVPRIPPFRLLVGLEAQSDLVDGRIEVERVAGQDRIAAFETPTDGYTMVNASLALHPFGDDNDSSITLSANNIFDVTARRHASFLKDFAPLAGRDFRITARLSF